MTAGALSTAEAAARLGVSVQRVGVLLRSGKLRGRREGRAWLVDDESVEERLARVSETPAAKPPVETPAVVSPKPPPKPLSLSGARPANGSSQGWRGQAPGSPVPGAVRQSAIAQPRGEVAATVAQADAAQARLAQLRAERELRAFERQAAADAAQVEIRTARERLELERLRSEDAERREQQAREREQERVAAEARQEEQEVRRRELERVERRQRIVAEALRTFENDVRAKIQHWDWQQDSRRSWASVLGQAGVARAHIAPPEPPSLRPDAAALLVRAKELLDGPLAHEVDFALGAGTAVPLVVRLRRLLLN